MLYHLRLIKALSYHGVVEATREQPDVFTEDENAALAAVASGYFELVENIPTDPGADEGESAEVAETDTETPGPEPSLAVSPDFETLAAMTKQELIAYAKEREIDLAKCRTKEDILGAISVFYGGSYTMIDLQKE